MELQVQEATSNPSFIKHKENASEPTHIVEIKACCCCCKQDVIQLSLFYGTLVHVECQHNHYH